MRRCFKIGRSWPITQHPEQKYSAVELLAQKEAGYNEARKYAENVEAKLDIAVQALREISGSSPLMKPRAATAKAALKEVGKQ